MPPPTFVQIAVGPRGELVALDDTGKLWCSVDPRGKGLTFGGIVRVMGQGYTVAMAPVTVQVKRWDHGQPG